MTSILGISAFYHDSAAALILNGKIIALVDDVLTTGFTIFVCAMKLKEMGSQFVIAITCCTPKFET